MAAKVQDPPEPAEVQFRWDDARVLLALSRARTLSGAGARLGVDASTVGRRVEALEAALGARLFERTPDGAVPTAAAEALIGHAEAMEAAAAALSGAVDGLEREVEGTVRLSVPPGVSDFFVAPRLAALLARHPLLRIELDARIAYVDLARREADLALRSHRPEKGDLVAARVMTASGRPYVAASLAARLGTLSDLGAAPWITWGHELAHLDDARWISSAVPERAIVLRTSSMASQVVAAESGLGVALLPDSLIAARPGLVPLRMTRALAARLPPLPEASLWIVAHRAMRQVPRVAAVWDFVMEVAHEGAPRKRGTRG